MTSLHKCKNGKHKNAQASFRYTELHHTPTHFTELRLSLSHTHTHFTEMSLPLPPPLLPVARPLLPLPPHTLR